MESLSRRIALVHHKVHHWDTAISKAFTEDPAKLRPQRATEHRISQHINQHFFHSTSSGAKEVTGKSLRLSKKQNEDALSEMLKSVARLGVSGATNQELEKERADVSRACLLLLQLETWLDIAGGNDFLTVPAHHLGVVQTPNDLLEDAFKVVKLRFPTANDSYDVLQRIEGDIDMMIELLAWTCAIDRRLLAVDAGYTRLIDICCSVRVRKAVTSEREAFLSAFDQAAQHLRQLIARLLNGYTTFNTFNSPTYAIILPRFDAVTHTTRVAPLTIRVPHSLTQDSIYLAMKLMFGEFQTQVPESLTLLVNPIAPDEILGMGKAARDHANKGTIQYARDVKVAMAWKSVKDHESRVWAKRSRRSGAAGRYASILILQRAWRKYLACRDAVRYCAGLAMLRAQRQAVKLIVSWWRRRKMNCEMRDIRLYEAALRRHQIRDQLLEYYHFGGGVGKGSGISNNKLILSPIIGRSHPGAGLLSSVVSEYQDEEEQEDDERVDVTVSSINDSEKDHNNNNNNNENANNNSSVIINKSFISVDHSIDAINNESNIDTPWRNIPVRWKQTQKKNYAANQNINYYNSNSENNNNKNEVSALNISILSSTPSIGNQILSSPSSMSASSPTRHQRDSMIFCAARRIQNFMIYVRFIKIRDRRREEEKLLIDEEERQQQYQEEHDQETTNYASSRYNQLPLAPSTSSVAAGSVLDLRRQQHKLNEKKKRPSSATSSVLEKFRRIRREQQQLAEQYRWDVDDDERANKEDNQTKNNSNNNNNKRGDSPVPSVCLSSVENSGDDDYDDQQQDPIQRSLSRSTYHTEQKEQEKEDRRTTTSYFGEERNSDTTTTESLTYTSLKKLSESFKRSMSAAGNTNNQKVSEIIDEKKKEGSTANNTNNTVHHDPSASEHLKHALDSIPIVFKVAKKGDGNVLVRPDAKHGDGDASSDANNNNEDDDDDEDELVFNEEEFKKQLMAQTGKTEIEPEELQKHKLVAEKYIQDVAKLENHRADEIALSSMRGESSKLLLSSVASLLIRKENLMFELSNLKAQATGYVPIENRSKWVLEELRTTVSRLRKDEKQDRRKRNKGKQSSTKKKQQESDGEEVLGEEMGHVLSSDDDVSPNKTTKNPKSPARTTKSPTKDDAIRKPQLLSPINNNNKSREDENETSQQQNDENFVESLQQQLPPAFLNADAAQSLLNAASTPILNYKIAQHDLRHPYQNWSNATQILRSISRKGLQELVARIRKEDLRDMFQFSDEELYKKETVTVVKRIPKESSKQNTTTTDDSHGHNSLSDNDDDDDSEEETEVEEERLVLDEMALHRQQEQARESTLQLICETAGTNSLQDAISFLSTDVSKIVADENRPIVSILRTMLNLESRRLIVPWIIIVGAGKEFNEIDPEVIKRQLKREEHEDKIEAQKQRRSRRRREKVLQKQQLIVQFKHLQEEKRKELEKKIEANENNKKIKAFAKLQRREGRMQRKKEAAELKKFKAAQRAAKKEKKNQKELEKQQKKDAAGEQEQQAKEVEKENTNSAVSKKRPASSPPSKKPSSSTKTPPPRATSAGKTRPTNKNQNGKSPSSTPQQKSLQEKPLSSRRSLSSHSSVSSISSTSSDVSSIGLSSVGSSSASSTNSSIERQRETIEEWEKKIKHLQIHQDDIDDDEENASDASSTILSYHSSDDDEEYEENENDDLNSEHYFMEDQTEFDDQALVITRQPLDSPYPLTFDDLERMRYHQFLKAATSNCNLQEFFDFIMKSDQSLVRKWLNIPLPVSRNKTRIKRRIDLMLLGSLMLPFLKTLQQWFESNFVFAGDDANNNNNPNHQIQGGNPNDDDSFAGDDENGYLQNETFDEDYSGEDEEAYDEEDDEMHQGGSLPPLMDGGTGRGDADGDLNLPSIHDDQSAENENETDDRVMMAERPGGRLGFQDDDEEGPEEL